MAAAIALLLLFSFASAPVQAGVPIILYACDKTTCTFSEREDFDNAHTTPDINRVSESNSCPKKCSTVRSGDVEVHVIGDMFDISCRAWGGNFCSWDKAMPHDDFLERVKPRK